MNQRLTHSYLNDDLPNGILSEADLLEHYKKVYIVVLAEVLESLKKQEELIRKEAQYLTSEDANHVKLATILGDDTQIAAEGSAPPTSFKSLKQYIAQEQERIALITKALEIELKRRKLTQEQKNNKIIEKNSEIKGKDKLVVLEQKFKNLRDSMLITLNNYPKASFFESMKRWAQSTLDYIFGRKTFSTTVRQTAKQMESTVKKTIDDAENTVSIARSGAFWVRCVSYGEESNPTAPYNNKQKTNRPRRNTI